MRLRVKKIIFNKNNFKAVSVFLFSVTEFLSGVYPFGMPALSVWGGGPLFILFYVLGILVSKMGFSAYLRHIFALVIYEVSKRFLKGKTADFVLVGSSVLMGGLLSLIILKERRAVMFSYAATEAFFSALYAFVFKRTKDVLRDKMRGEGVTEGEFAFPLLSGMTLCLAFSALDLGRLSLSSGLLLILGMVAAYKYSSPVSAVVNMAVSFFCLSFTPENMAVVAYLTLAGFTASLLKKLGKFMVPATYLLILPLFAGARVNVTTIYIEDIVFASGVFLMLPGKVFSFLSILPKNENEEVSFIRLSEKVNIAADTFYSVSRFFKGLDLRMIEKDGKDAPHLTVETVCKDCTFNGRCKKEAESVLRRYVDEGGRLWEKDITCVRKRELLSAFSANYRVLRMEEMWNNHIKETNEAMTEEMDFIAKMLKGISVDDNLEIKRDETSERELKSAFKKSGINVRNIVAGRNKRGLFHVMIDLLPIKDKTFCDDYFPYIIKETLGLEVVRHGTWQYDESRACFFETPPLKIEKAVSIRSEKEVSGDSVAFAYVDDSHFAMALSDGMGTGAKAGYKSNAAANLSLKLLSAGMNIRSAPGMVNSLLLRQGGRDFVTLDMAIINLESGEVELSKNASASSYILKCGGRVSTLEFGGSPLGIVGKTHSGMKKYRIAEGDFLIMVSDGVADCFDGKESLNKKIGEFTLGSAENLADYIMDEALKIRGEKTKDDMTVAVVGCIKRQKSGKDKNKGGQAYEKRQKSNYFRQY